MRVWLLLLAGSPLVGCSDPIVGSWESDNELLCGGSTDRVEFTIDDDLFGTGEYCSCEFEFTADSRDADTYRFDIDFDGVCFIDDGKYDCTLERDGERLDCDNLGDYDRVGD